MRSSWITVSVACALLGAFGCETGDGSGSTAPEHHDLQPGSHEEPHGDVGGDTRTIYVPAYSHLSGGDERRMLLAITLSVRNVDPSATVTLTQVEYFDTSGHLVRRYLREPRRLRPLETVELTVDARDESGGSGANFLVYWRGPDGAQSLLTEAIMFGHVGTGYMSFTSRGVELARPPELPALDPAAPIDGPTPPGTPEVPPPEE